MRQSIQVPKEGNKCTISKSNIQYVRYKEYRVGRMLITNAYENREKKFYMNLLDYEIGLNKNCSEGIVLITQWTQTKKVRVPILTYINTQLW